MSRYDITTVGDTLNQEIADWLRSSLTKDQYSITNDGFLIDFYYVTFMDPAAEMLYLLRWT